MSQINVAQVIEGSKFNSFHLSVLLWCIFLILFDGYDLTVFYINFLSFAIPALIAAISISFVQNKYNSSKTLKVSPALDAYQKSS